VTVQVTFFFSYLLEFFISSIVANKVSFPSRLLFLRFIGLLTSPKGKKKQPKYFVRWKSISGYYIHKCARGFQMKIQGRNQLGRVKKKRLVY
jgi:hypothetical protein